MKVVILVCVFFILPLGCFSECLKNNSQYIYWEDDLTLKLSDFHIRTTKELMKAGYMYETYADSNSTKTDLIAGLGTTIQFEAKDNIESNAIVVCAFSFVDKESSVYLKDFEDRRVIEHEFIHFAISEICARELKKEVSSLKNLKNYKLLRTRIFEIRGKWVVDSLNALNKRFDTEDYQCPDTSTLEKWKEYVYSRLKSLEKYKSDRVRLYYRRHTRR